MRTSKTLIRLGGYFQYQICKSYAFTMRSYMYSDVQSCLIHLSVDMICRDNCLQPNPVLFVCMVTCGKGYSQWGVGGRGLGVLGARTTLPNLPLLAQSKKKNKKQKNTQIHSYMCKRLKFISFQCALDVFVISGGGEGGGGGGVGWCSRKLGKIQVCIETR